MNNMVLNHVRAAIRADSTRRRGFTLMEMLVVVAIIVVLASVGGYYFFGVLGKSNADVARVKAKTTLEQAAKTYYMDHKQQWPPSLEALLQKDEMGGPYLENVDALKDPWGKPFQYNAGGPNNGGIKPDIWTTGPEGQQIGNWQ
jgi:general secretion pathway protein G